MKWIDLTMLFCSNSDITSLDKELKQYDNLKNERQQIYESKGEATMKVSIQCMWAEKGKRPTKNIFSISKKTNDIRKVISELEVIDDKGEITKKGQQILLKIENYYRFYT